MTGGPGEDEELDLGLRTPWSARLLRRFGWRWRAGAAVVVAAVVIPLIVVSQLHTPSTTPHAIPSHLTTPHLSTPPAVGIRAQPSSGPPTVRRTRPFVLGIHSGWELFGRGETGVVRIEFARGRVTTTPVPPLASAGPVSFVAGRHAVLIRPLDLVPGYLVPDGKRAARPAHPLDCRGPALPGPQPDTVWVARCEGRPRLLLTRFDGTRTGASLPVPGGNSPIEVLPDGQGYLLFPGSVIGTVETFDVRPGRASSTLDHVLAVGPTRLLVQTCNRTGRCRGDAVVDRADGKQRPITIPFASGDEPGVISPDGRSAALPLSTPDPAIMYIDLATGAIRDLTLQPDVSDEQTVAWSPDSRWLFVLSRQGDLYAVDGHTGKVVEDLTGALHLPLLNQLAIRPAPPSS